MVTIVTNCYDRNTIQTFVQNIAVLGFYWSFSGAESLMVSFVLDSTFWTRSNFIRTYVWQIPVCVTKVLRSVTTFRLNCVVFESIKIDFKVSVFLIKNGEVADSSRIWNGLVLDFPVRFLSVLGKSSRGLGGAPRWIAVPVRTDIFRWKNKSMEGLSDLWLELRSPSGIPQSRAMRIDDLVFKFDWSLRKKIVTTS